ncbi:hypothetical protein GQ457_16G016300 [Hibiscus cannabinus]
MMLLALHLVCGCLLKNTNDGLLGNQPHTNEARQHDDVAGGSRFNTLHLDGEEAQFYGNIPNSGQVNDFVHLIPRSTRKGKQPVAVKKLRAVNVRKPLTTSLNDFPIFPWPALKASSSRGTRASHKVAILTNLAILP